MAVRGPDFVRAPGRTRGRAALVDRGGASRWLCPALPFARIDLGPEKESRSGCWRRCYMAPPLPPPLTTGPASWHCPKRLRPSSLRSRQRPAHSLSVFGFSVGFSACPDVDTAPGSSRFRRRFVFASIPAAARFLLVRLRATRASRADPNHRPAAQGRRHKLLPCPSVTFSIGDVFARSVLSCAYFVFWCFHGRP